MEHTTRKGCPYACSDMRPRPTLSEAFSRLDVPAAVTTLADDIEVIDHVSSQFDGKAEFTDFLNGEMAGVA